MCTIKGACVPLLLVLTFCLGSVEAFSQNRVRLHFGTTEVLDQGSLVGYQYKVQLRAEASGSSWLVRQTYAVISYNTAALAVVEGNLTDMDVSLSASGYTAKVIDYPGLGIFTVELKEPSTRNFVTKSSAIFNLGTIRFEVKDGNLTDDLQFVVSGSYKTTVNHDEGIGAPPSDWLSLDYNCGNSNCFTVTNPTPQVIFTPACQNQFYKAHSCDKEALASPTNDPLGQGYLRWPRKTVAGGSDPHVAYYRYDLQNNIPTGARANAFNATQLEGLMDWGRCRWEKQCGDELQWQTTTVGGRMWWGVTEEDMLSPFNARNAAAVTCLAFQENDYRYIVPASSCGCPRHGMSEIIFNNTPFYYNSNPGIRWTTNYTQCGGNTNCVDFQSVSVHELGHYIGLPHNWRTADLMNEYGYTGQQLSFYACDADRARMLYNPSLVSSQPHNGAGCLTTDVEEQSEYEVVDLNVLVYPVPVYGDKFTVKYTVQRPGTVTVHLLDLFGNIVQTFATEPQGIGAHTLQCPIKGLSNGAYYLKVGVHGMYRVQKIIIQR